MFSETHEVDQKVKPSVSAAFRRDLMKCEFYEIYREGIGKVWGRYGKSPIQFSMCGMGNQTEMTVRIPLGVQREIDTPRDQSKQAFWQSK